MIYHVLEKQITQSEASGLVGLSERQIRQIVQSIREEGDKGIIYKSKGSSIKNEENLPSFVEVVSAGITEIISKQNTGYAYVKP